MNTALILVFGIILFLLGGIIGWFLFFLKHKKINDSTLDLQIKIQTAENVILEFKKQAEQKDAIIDALRLQSGTIQQLKTVAETRLEEAQKNIDEQKKILENAQQKLTTTFQALAGESLKSNNKAFVELAKQTLDAVLAEAKGDIGKKEQSIKSLITPLEDALKRYEVGIKDIEAKRDTAYGSIENQIKSLIATQQLLQSEAGNLVKALRRPEVRGRYGEMTLKRVAELAGMSGYCDYTEQVSTDTENGKIRPDMIVHLPAEREIVIDSKLPLDAYLDAIGTDSDEKRKEFILKHAQQVRKHMKDLSSKNYWGQFQKAPEFVVMFIPGEAFLNAALEVDRTLTEDGMESRVIIATPTTLIALLRAIAYGWRQEQITKNAQVVAELGRELYERFGSFMGHLTKTRGSIEQTVFNFNRMLGSFEGRIMPSVRKFKELGATGGDELPIIEPIEQMPRLIESQIKQDDSDK
ncbi:MAG: DNA recombination protein RmuC [Deltaproteobacteria bacterium]|nr:DNA recombination protein RmuC [Deltaproteobacteria bacterium]